jgi:hypothetical protein
VCLIWRKAAVLGVLSLIVSTLIAITRVKYVTIAMRIDNDGEGGNSPFVSAIIKNIEIPGVEINFLFRKVRDEVLKATSGRQEPYVYGSLPAEAFYFRRP